MHTRPGTNHSARTYYPQNRTTLLGLGVVNGLAATYLFASTAAALSQGEALSWGNPGSLIPLTISLLIFAMGLSARIVVTPEALVFSQLGMRAYTPWANVLRISPRQVGPQSIDCVHLGAPAVIDWCWIAAGYRDRILTLPLLGYAYGPGSPLRADLERYAPQLRTPGE